jgi:hypothetical protein
MRTPWTITIPNSSLSGKLKPEKEYRYSVFKANFQEIEKHNKKSETYELGLNVFADLTQDEFYESYLGLNKP